MENRLKWTKNATFTILAQRFSPRRRVLCLGEGQVSSIWVLFIRLGEGKLRLGECLLRLNECLLHLNECLLRLGEPKTCLLLCPSFFSTKDAFTLGKPPRLDKAVPSSTSFAFFSFSSFFACFYFLFLQNISKWGISVIFRNLV